MSTDHPSYVMTIAAGVEIEVSAEGWACAEFPALAKVMDMVFPAKGEPKKAAEQAHDRYKWDFVEKPPKKPDLAVSGV